MSAMRHHGEEGVFMLTVRREDKHRWEPVGVTYEPFWPGQIDETTAAIQDAIDTEADSIILPILPGCRAGDRLGRVRIQPPSSRPRHAA